MIGVSHVIFSLLMVLVVSNAVLTQTTQSIIGAKMTTTSTITMEATKTDFGRRPDGPRAKLCHTLSKMLSASVAIPGICVNPI